MLISEMSNTKEPRAAITKKLPRIVRERASDTAYRIIRERILRHAFIPGERLDLRQLSAQLEVSMTPVNDAVKRLVTEGLIEVQPQSGTFVTRIVPDEIAEIFEIRLALECLAAERAVKCVTASEIAALRHILGELEQPAADEESRAMYINRDFEFHTKIVHLSGNRKLIDLYESVDAHIKVARMLYSNDRWTRRIKHASVEHAEILQQLAARDAEGLVKALRRHIERASKGLVDDLRQMEVNGR